MALVVGLFAYFWRTGQLLSFADYVRETREELRKCTWPTWPELKGSTLVVIISILLLGVFTFVVDLVFHLVLRRIS